VFLIAREESTAIGCGAWQLLPDGAAELRHVWVSDEARGFGLGRRLLERLEASAAAHGVRVLRLGTNSALPEAIAMFRSSGYYEIPPYSDSEYNQLNFEKKLL
jgi:N-acetylglutamate synthase-like GNAT family acetyltransferase